MSDPAPSSGAGSSSAPAARRQSPGCLPRSQSASSGRREVKHARQLCVISHVSRCLDGPESMPRGRARQQAAARNDRPSGAARLAPRVSAVVRLLALRRRSIGRSFTAAERGNTCRRRSARRGRTCAARRGMGSFPRGTRARLFRLVDARCTRSKCQNPLRGEAISWSIRGTSCMHSPQELDRRGRRCRCAGRHGDRPRAAAIVRPAMRPCIMAGAMNAPSIDARPFSPPKPATSPTA